MGKFKLKRKTFGWKGWTAGLGAAGAALGGTMFLKDTTNLSTGDVNSNSGKGAAIGGTVGLLGAGALAVAGLAKGGAGVGKGVKKAWNWGRSKFSKGAASTTANATKNVVTNVSK